MSPSGRPIAGCEVLSPMEPSGPTARNGKPKNKKLSAQRFETLNNFVDFTAAALSRSEVLVWLILYRDTRNGIAKVSQADIARRGGMNARSVRRALEKLESSALVTVAKRGGFRQGATAYQVHPLKALQPDTSVRL